MRGVSQKPQPATWDTPPPEAEKASVRMTREGVKVGEDEQALTRSRPVTLTLYENHCSWKKEIGISAISSQHSLRCMPAMGRGTEHCCSLLSGGMATRPQQATSA